MKNIFITLVISCILFVVLCKNARSNTALRLITPNTSLSESVFYSLRAFSSNSSLEMLVGSLNQSLLSPLTAIHLIGERQAATSVSAYNTIALSNSDIFAAGKLYNLGLGPLSESLDLCLAGQNKTYDELRNFIELSIYRGIDNMQLVPTMKRSLYWISYLQSLLGTPYWLAEKSLSTGIGINASFRGFSLNIHTLAESIEAIINSSPDLELSIEELKDMTAFLAGYSSKEGENIFADMMENLSNNLFLTLAYFWNHYSKQPEQNEVALEQLQVSIVETISILNSLDIQSGMDLGKAIKDPKGWISKIGNVTSLSPMKVVGKVSATTEY